jgi:hypothetical protein
VNCHSPDRSENPFWRRTEEISPYVEMTKALKRLQRTAGIASNKTLKNKKIFPKEDHN